MMTSWHGYTIFCDDIRQEIGNKLSFIGIYTGLMQIHVPFPVTLPRLCIYAIGVHSWDEALREIRAVDFKIWFPGNSGEEPSINVPVYRHDQGQPVPSLPPLEDAFNDPDIDRQMRIAVPMWIETAVIPSPGNIKVRAVIDSQVVKLGALRVAAAPPPSGQQP
jgi:hypothetical protein